MAVPCTFERSRWSNDRLTNISFFFSVLVMNREKPPELIMPCLGRPFQLGMLYNCHTDQLLPSVALWNREKLKQDAIDSKPKQFSNFEVIADDSINTKFSKLGVNINLKLSILGGLVNVSGAATYLNDQVSSRNQVRVSLKCESTVRVEQLALEKLGDLDNADVFKDTTATHFVSGILYGANAVFIFDREVQPNEDFHDVHDFMKSMVEKLPTISTSGNAALDISDTDKKEIQKVRCKLYCDLPLPKNPTTFDGAVKLCKDLPRLLSASDSPKQIRLCPLSRLDSTVAPITLDISMGLVDQTQEFMEKHHELEMRSNDLMNSTVCISFPEIKEQLSCFNQRIAEYKADSLKKLATLLPQIRGGDEEETKLAELFTAQHASPFNHERLSSWVKGKTTEIKVLGKYLDSLQGIEFVLPDDLLSVIGDPEYDHVISFTFNVAGRHDPYLDEMTTYLRTPEIPASQEVMNPTPWYNDPEIIRDIKSQTRQFKTFAKANVKMNDIKFVVTSSSSSSSDKQGDKGAFIELHDSCEKEIFEPPSKPGKPSATSVTRNSIELKWTKPENGAQNVQFYTVFYCDLSSSPEQWKEAKTNGIKESIIVNDLATQKEYCFKVQAECKVGISATSDSSDRILLPVIPDKPTASNVTHNSMQLQWSRPQRGVQKVKDYTIFYRTMTSSPCQWKELLKTEGAEESIKVSGLDAQTLYTFKVHTEYEDGISLVSDTSDSIQTTPPPVRPGKPSAFSVTHDSIQLQWSKAQYGSQNVKFYTVSYHEVNNPPNPESQWKEIKMDCAKESTVVSDLAAQTMYIFKVHAEFLEDSLVSDISEPIQTISVPVNPGKPTASNITHNSLELKWSKAEYGGQNMEFYTVFSNEIKDSSGPEQWVERVRSNEESVIVTGLAVKTSYTFKICAKFNDTINLASEVSDSVYLPILPGKPCATSVTHDSIQLQWSRAQYGTQNVKLYTIFYHESKDPPELVTQWKEYKTNGSKESITVNGLAPQTFYSFKVHAEFQTDSWESEASEPIQTAPPPVNPGKPIAFNVTHDSLQLQWSQAQYAGSQNVEHYTIFYREIKDLSDSKCQWKEYKRDGCSKESKTLCCFKLSAEALYSFKVCAEFQECTLVSGISEPIQTMPAPIYPGKPTAFNVTRNSLELQWSKAQYAGSQNAKHYTIFYRVVKDLPHLKSQWKKCKTDDCSKEFTTVSCLAAETMYSFKVCAEFQECTLVSDISDSIKTDPLSVNPGKPTAFNVTHNSLELKWSKAQHKSRAQDIVVYTVHHKNQSDPKSKWNNVLHVESTGAEEFIMAAIPHLTPQAKYLFKVDSRIKFTPRNKKLMSEISDPIQMYPAPVRPGKPTASNVNHDSLELKWSPAQYKAQNAESYTVLYHDQSDPKRKWKELKAEIKESTMLVTQLTPKRHYSFKVCAKFKTGEEFESNVNSIQTSYAPVPPGKPQEVRVTHNSIQLKWTKALFAAQKLEFYSIHYRKEQDPSRWLEAKVKISEESYIASHLAPKTKYYFKVCAKFEPGGMKLNSDISNPIETYSLPVPPGKPNAVNITHNSIELKWSKAQYGPQKVEYYTIFYRRHAEQHSHERLYWVEANATAENSFTLINLYGKTNYSFRVQAKFCNLEPLQSEVSDPFQTSPSPVIPGKPYSYNSTHNSIGLHWSEPQYGAQSIKFYTVFYREQNDPTDKWQNIKVRHTPDEEPVIVRHLAASTVYYFKIHAEIKDDCDSLISHNSEQSEPITTMKRIATQLLSPNPIKDGPLEIHMLPMIDQMKDEARMIRKCVIKNESVPLLGAEEKVLMVMGATGAGKSTLINGMINYILGVEWDDPFRFKLIGEEGGQSQSKSQTKWITAYTLPRFAGSTLPYTLTIIDTPGFGDTEGLERDKFITTQIKHFFTSQQSGGIDHIDGIGFVTPSSQARLTPTQRYIFTSILSIFGKNVADNIFIMVTFADGQHPPVMTAIKDADIITPKDDAGKEGPAFYKFNNSALFADNQSAKADVEGLQLRENFDAMFWRMGVDSFRDFFHDFHLAKHTSLQLTIEVLEERDRLQTIVNGLQPQIRMGIAKIEEVRQEEAVLLKHKHDIEQNKDFTYFVDVTKQKKIDLKGTGVHVTNCLQCHFTCHEKCMIPRDEDKHGCWAMDKRTGHCRICTKNCIWSEHVNNPYRFEERKEKEKRTSKDLKQKYDDAVSGENKQRHMMDNMEKELKAMHTKVLTMIKQVQTRLQRLDEIALKPNPLTEVGFLETLIISEKQQAKKGWLERVKYFEAAKEQAIMLKSLNVQEIVERMEKIPQEPCSPGDETAWYNRFKYWLVSFVTPTKQQRQQQQQ